MGALSHGQINNGYLDGPVACPAGFYGEVSLFCSNGTTTVAEVMMQGDLDVYRPDSTENGTNASEAELGVNPYSNRILLCECCEPPDRPPGGEPVPTRDEWVILYWGVALATFGLVASIAVSSWIVLKMKKKPKLSAVHPEPPRFSLRDAGTQDLPDFSAIADKENPQGNQLALTGTSLPTIMDSKDSHGKAKRKQSPKGQRATYTHNTYQTGDKGNLDSGSGMLF